MKSFSRIKYSGVALLAAFAMAGGCVSSHKQGKARKTHQDQDQDPRQNEGDINNKDKPPIQPAPSHPCEHLEDTQHSHFLHWCEDDSLSVEKQRTLQGLLGAAGVSISQSNYCFEADKFFSRNDTTEITLSVENLVDLSPLMGMNEYPHIRTINISINENASKCCPMFRTKTCRFSRVSRP